MPNFDDRLESIPGYEYPNFILATDVDKVFSCLDGNTVVQDKQGRLFNVHPKIRTRWNTVKRVAEDMPLSYPVRWQLTSVYDVPKDIQNRIK
jgi:hypothetical protein